MRLKANGFSYKCNAYFIEQNSCLVFQVWGLEKQISESIWIKTDKQNWQYYIKTLDQKFNKSFLLNEIIEIEKDFIFKNIKQENTSNYN